MGGFHVERLSRVGLRCRCPRVDVGCACSREGAYRSTRWHRDIDVLGTTRDHAARQVGDLYAFCDIVVA